MADPNPPMSLRDMLLRLTDEQLEGEDDLFSNVLKNALRERSQNPEHRVCSVSLVFTLAPKDADIEVEGVRMKVVHCMDASSFASLAPLAAGVEFAMEKIADAEGYMENVAEA